MKNYQEIKEEVVKLIAVTLNISEVDIHEDASLADLTEDSIQLFEVLLAFEKKYDVETSYDDVVNLHTVGDVVRYVQKMVYSQE